jgi:hypothetical protein
MPETLKQLNLWKFLDEGTRSEIFRLTGTCPDETVDDTVEVECSVES